MKTKFLLCTIISIFCAHSLRAESDAFIIFKQAIIKAVARPDKADWQSVEKLFIKMICNQFQPLEQKATFVNELKKHIALPAVESIFAKTRRECRQELHLAEITSR